MQILKWMKTVWDLGILRQAFVCLCIPRWLDWLLAMIIFFFNSLNHIKWFRKHPVWFVCPKKKIRWFWMYSICLQVWFLLVSWLCLPQLSRFVLSCSSNTVLERDTHQHVRSYPPAGDGATFFHGYCKGADSVEIAENRFFIGSTDYITYISIDPAI